MLKLLLYIGIIRRKDDGSIRWPLWISPRKEWREWRIRGKCWGWFYVFRNLPGVIKWVPGRLLPRRWGFGIAGLIEFGDRG